MKKDLAYYMALPYTIEVVTIPDSEGGGFAARLPEIGRDAITGDGETPQEAIENLEEAKRARFVRYLEKGIKIPEPISENEFSGRFLQRVPAKLHMALSKEAKSEGLSLNQYVKSILETHTVFTYEHRAATQQEDRLLKIIESLRKELETLSARIESLEDCFRMPIGIESQFVTDATVERVTSVISSTSGRQEYPYRLISNE